MTESTADIEIARAALARESWAEAYDLLRALDPSELTGRDLEGLAEAAWWRSELDEAIGARQKAYAAYLAEGNDLQAGYMAVRLSIEHFERGEPAVGAGWLKRARSHLQDSPECSQLGFLRAVEATVALEVGDLDDALAGSRQARGMGQRCGDPNLEAMAIVSEGFAVIESGRVDEGLSLLDEAMTSVIAGELSSFFTGAVYCRVIQACLEQTDVRRAAEWSQAASAWCRSISPDSPYPGQCRVNRAEVARLRGDWAEAEVEAEIAVAELTRIRPDAAGAAHYTLGEVRTRLGDHEGAGAEFARAHALGHDPQPGLALLRLSEGKAENARVSLRLALSGDSVKPARRAALLATLVDADLAVGDRDAAGRSRDELEAAAHAVSTPAIRALVETARGSVALALGEVPEALEHLRNAVTIWHALALPYETATARMRFGLAIRATGDEEGAELELRSALAAFERLGAVPEASRAAELLAGPHALPGGLTTREAEVLRLVAAGKTNRDIAVELVISEHTVARHLQNIFAKLDVSTRSAATKFAFEHDLT